MAHMKPAPTKPLDLPATVDEWRLYARIGKRTFENLPPDCRPHTATFGPRKVMVVETPLDWMRRVSAIQMAPPPRRAKRAAKAANPITREAA